MAIVETGDHLGIHDDAVFDGQIRDQCADELSIVADFMHLLLVAADALFDQLDYQCPFVEFLIETWTQRVQHFHRRPDHDLGEIRVVRWVLVFFIFAHLCSSVVKILIQYCGTGARFKPQIAQNSQMV